MSRQGRRGPYKMNAGRWNDAKELRWQITNLIRDSKKSRAQIAEEMSALLQTKVTPRALDSYTAESADQNRWPAQYDIAFCEVIGNYELLQIRVKRAGFRMIGAKEEQLIKLGRAYLAQAKAQKRLMEGISL